MDRRLPRCDGKVCLGFALNEHGEVAGFCTRQAPDTIVSRPCYWRNGKGRDLGILQRGDRGRALALNDAAQVVGRTGTGPPSGKSHAFVWERGRLTDLGGLHGTDWSVALAITDNGVVLGNSKRTRVSASHAVVWTRSS